MAVSHNTITFYTDSIAMLTSRRDQVYIVTMYQNSFFFTIFINLTLARPIKRKILDGDEMLRWYNLLRLAGYTIMPAKKRRKEPVSGSIKKLPGYHYCLLHKKTESKLKDIEYKNHR